MAQDGAGFAVMVCDWCEGEAVEVGEHGAVCIACRGICGNSVDNGRETVFTTDMAEAITPGTEVFTKVAGTVRAGYVLVALSSGRYGVAFPDGRKSVIRTATQITPKGA